MVVTVTTLALLLNTAFCWGIEIRSVSIKTDNLNEIKDNVFQSNIFRDYMRNLTNTFLQADETEFDKVKPKSNLIMEGLSVTYIGNGKNHPFSFPIRESGAAKEISPHASLKPEKGIMSSSFASENKRNHQVHLNANKEARSKSENIKFSKQPTTAIVMNASPALLVIIAFMAVLLFIFGAVIACMCSIHNEKKNIRQASPVHQGTMV